MGEACVHSLINSMLSSVIYKGLSPVMLLHIKCSICLTQVAVTISLYLSDPNMVAKAWAIQGERITPITFPVCHKGQLKRGFALG